MSDSQISIMEISSSTNDLDNGIISSNIKQEVVPDDDILLFTSAEMEEFSGDPNNYQIVEEIVNSGDSLTSNTSFNIQAFDENQVSQFLTGENLKFSTDLAQICKLESGKNENTSHFVKYKMQDGKHCKVWECGICSKEFGHQYTLMRHLPTHTDERKFQCNICGKAFRQMSTLSQHRAIHSAERPYVCEICHKTFNRVSTLISHRKTHTGLKPHRCHLCNKAFHQKGNLRNHIFTHTNERPYKCDVCEKGFNQMSNLMCHKVKAHQRADKPRFVCQICGKDFQKRIGLRNHEQYQHGMQNLDTGSCNSMATRVKYTNGVLVEPINTAAMQHALSTNQTPFALLRPLNGIPVLVRVLAAGDKQMLVPATAEDLKRHGQITITPQVDDQNKKNVVIEAEQDEKSTETDENSVIAKTRGSTVQIKIPVVATVTQRCGEDGNMLMAIQSPGPNNERTVNEEYVFTTTNNNSNCQVQDDAINIFPQSMETHEINNFEDMNGVHSSTQIQYMDECGNLLNEYDAKNTIFGDNFQFDQPTTVFTMDMQMENGIISLPDSQHDILKEIDAENMMNINCGDGNSSEPIFEVDLSSFQPSLVLIQEYTEILEKPQVISLSDSDPVLDFSNVLYDDNITSAKYEVIP